MQAQMLASARARREAHSVRGITRDQLVALMAGDGGLAYGGYCGAASCEQEVQEQTKATIRVLPDPEFRSAEAPVICAWCGRPSVAEAVWAKAY